MTVIQEKSVPSVSPEIIKTISKIKKPTPKQELIINTLTQTTDLQLGYDLAKELAETVSKEEPKGR